MSCAWRRIERCSSRRRAIAQRAARTFSVDRGEFVIDDEIALPIVAGSEIDVRSVIYLGARQNLSEARLDGDLELFGEWFRLQPSAIEDLPQFGFTEADRPILERLQVGATIDDLEADGIDPPHRPRHGLRARLVQRVRVRRGPAAGRRGPPDRAAHAPALRFAARPRRRRHGPAEQVLGEHRPAGAHAVGQVLGEHRLAGAFLAEEDGRRRGIGRDPAPDPGAGAGRVRRHAAPAATARPGAPRPSASPAERGRPGSASTRGSSPAACRATSIRRAPTRSAR